MKTAHIRSFTLACLSLILLLSGCATVLTGVKQKIEFASTPEHAKVFINDELRGETPSTIRVRKGESHSITFKKDHYRDYKTILASRKFHWTFYLNLLTLENTLYVDIATGAAEIYDPADVYVKMIPMAPKVTSSLSVTCKDIHISIDPDAVIGNRTKKNKIRGGVFLSGLGLREVKFIESVNKELKAIGLNNNQGSAGITLNAEIIELRHDINKIKGDNFKSISTIKVEWQLLDSFNVPIYTATTTGLRTWCSEGSYSMELAFEEAFHKYLNDPELYKHAKAK